MSRFARQFRFVLFCDDEAYQELIGPLLAWDRRVILDQSSMRPASLLAYLDKALFQPDVVVVAGDYRDEEWPLQRLVEAIRERAPHCVIVVMLSYPLPELVSGAIAGGANAVFLKQDIRYGVVSAALRSCLTAFAYSAGVEQLLRAEHHAMFREASRVPSWRHFDGLEERYRRVAELLFLQGMEPALAAEVRGVSVGAVHTYKSKMKDDLLEDAWANGWYETSTMTPFVDALGEDEDALIRHLLVSLPAAA